jgi:hypothetical protein
MAEIPLYMLRDEHLNLQEMDSNKCNQEWCGPLNKLILPDLPTAQLQYLEETQAARLRATFHLLQDFAQHGWQGRLSRNGTENVVISLSTPDTPLSKQQIRKAMEPRRLELIRRSAEWIRRTEPMVMQHLVNGTQIVPLQINPELEECRSQKQHDIFRYCRFLSSVPYSEYVGRRMRFLIRDAALPSRPIIGIAALGSSLLQIRCRDEWIAWNTSELRDVKKLRIAYMMDLYVAVSVPPYSHLLGGKLICYAMTSNEIRKAFERKYKDKVTFSRKRIVKDLVMLVTTSVYGQHSAQYNRIRYKGNLLYIPVGETAGFGTLHISQDTFSALRDMLSAEETEISHKFGDGANWRLRVVREGMDRLGFDSDQCLRHGHSRGVYVVPLARNACEFLRGETDAIQYFDYPFEDLVSHWRKRWLEMRIRNSEILQQVRNFRADSLRLTRLLDNCE